MNCETIGLWCLWKLQSYFRGYTYICCKFDILSYTLVGMYLYDSNFQVDLQQCIEYFYNFKEPVLVSFLGYKKHSQMFFQTFFFYFSKKIKENFEVSSSRLLNFLEKRFIMCLLRKCKLQKMRIKRQTLQKVYIQEKL